MMTRRPLRENVRRQVLDKVLQGNLAPGDRLKEIALARELGVSRTPLREALRELEQVGLVHSVPGRGFSVTEFSVEEVREVWPLVWTLEGLALRASPAIPAKIETLERLNREIETRCQRPRECAELDAQWHRTLVRDATNGRLAATLESLTDVVRRYEYRFLDSPDRIATTVRHHHTIIRALLAGEVDRAAQVLEEHRRLDMETLLTIMEHRVSDA